MRRRNLLRALGTACAALSLRAETAPEAFRAGVDHFFAGRMAESAAAFDRVIALDPAAKPQLWQRGLALYYAGRFADGREQFEVHRTVNPDDVENAAWHYLCVARAEGVEAARRALLPVGPDARVPMREILAIFAGTGGAEAVLAAAQSAPEPRRRDALCYAHLYLALYLEAQGQAEAALAHLRRAAGEFAMDHYMGRTAQIHLRLRTGIPPPAPASPP
jgi:lipoprotein NlpI